ncbi:hypothetical protein STENM223S_07517 [Streptomyces tendae]
MNKTTTRTRPVNTAPTALMILAMCWRRRSAGSLPVDRTWFQCRTMPVCESVKEVNTPRMYRWIRAVTLAWKPHSSRPAVTASATIPLEKASLSPRLCSWRGR